MKKSHFIICGILFGMMFVVGCQSEREPENRIMETDLGKIEIDESGQSARLIEDASEVVLQEDTGKVEIPEDLPVPENGEGINWEGTHDSGILSYKVNDKDYKVACEYQVSLLQTKGWSMENGVAINLNDTSTNTLNRDGHIVSVSCSEDNADSNSVKVTMVKGSE